MVQKTQEPEPWCRWMSMVNSPLRDVGVGSGFVEFRGAAAVAADGQFPKTDVEAVGIDLGAGVADGCGQASPVGIAASPGGLDQR